MRKLAASSLVLVLLTGCAVGPNYKQPPVTAPDVYRDVQGPPAPAASLADQPWWDVFGDPVLTQLIDEALAHRLRRPDRRRARRGGPGAGRHRPLAVLPPDRLRRPTGRAAATPCTVPPVSTATRNLNSVNVNFGWELDLWGRIRRLNEAAKAQYLASEDARRGVLLSLVSDVATTYFQLRELDEELAISKKTVAAFQETVRPLQAQARRGRGVGRSRRRTPRRPSARSPRRSPSSSGRSRRPRTSSTCSSGRNPGPIPRGEALAAQPVPPEIPAGLPSELLQRRPDVRQAEQQLIAANALVGVATANFFPAISLTGLFGAVEPRASTTSSTPPARPGRSRPACSARSSRAAGSAAEYDVTYAQWEQAKIQYEQTVTGAFAETTTVLYAREKIGASVAELERTVDDYGEMVRLSTLRYDSGLSNYFEVLYAMQQLFPAEIALARARLDLLIDYVDIYKALGGGWNLQPDDANPTWLSPAVAPPAAQQP